MTVRDVLNLMDHEVWVRIRPDGESEDMVLWSADWIGGDYNSECVDPYLDWDGDDISIEMRKDPDHPGSDVPMLVVRAFGRSKQT